MRLKNLKVRTKMFILGALIAGIMIFNVIDFLANMKSVSDEAINTLQSAMNEDYDSSIKEQVDNALTMLNGVYAGCEKGRLYTGRSKENGR